MVSDGKGQICNSGKPTRKRVGHQANKHGPHWDLHRRGEDKVRIDPDTGEPIDGNGGEDGNENGEGNNGNQSEMSWEVPAMIGLGVILIFTAPELTPWVIPALAF
jgi:hypothetical protein